MKEGLIKALQLYNARKELELKKATDPLIAKGLCFDQRIKKRTKMSDVASYCFPDKSIITAKATFSRVIHGFITTAKTVEDVEYGIIDCLEIDKNFLYGKPSEFDKEYQELVTKNP